jgi:hypothetical protein
VGFFSIFNKAYQMAKIEVFESNNLTIQSNSISLLEKLFVWSIIFEPLLLFTLPITIFSPFARILQFLFLFLYVLTIVLGKRKIPIVNLTKKYYSYFFLYTFCVVISSFVGIFSGSYIYNNYIIGNYVAIGVSLRPFLEFFILIYYLVYFVVLPKHILRTEIQFNYLLNWIVRILYFVLVAGIIDYLFIVYSGIDLIPRHIIDSRWVSVGHRFHSILGEPRDAFVYLLFATSILFFRSAVQKRNTPNIFLLALIILGLALTKSFSGIIGLILGIFLLIFFNRFSFKNLLVIFFTTLLLLIAVFFSIEHVVRLNQYFNELSNFLNQHEWISSDQIPYLIRVQAPDILPFIEIYNRFIEFDFYNVFFGSGAGSTSYFLNNYFNFSEYVVDNPRAQLTRIIFESGLIGTFFYLMALFRPVFLLKGLTENSYLNQIIFISCIFYGSVLGQRSHLAFIFVGIVIAYIEISRHKQKLH